MKEVNGIIASYADGLTRDKPKNFCVGGWYGMLSILFLLLLFWQNALFLLLLRIKCLHLQTATAGLFPKQEKTEITLFWFETF